MDSMPGAMQGASPHTLQAPVQALTAPPCSSQHLESYTRTQLHATQPPTRCPHPPPAQAAFPALFKRILTLKDERALKQHERTAYLVFAINTFQSLEDEMVRGQVLKLVSLPLWHALGKGRLQLELHAHPQLAKHWKSLTKKENKAAGKPGYVPVGGALGLEGGHGCGMVLQPAGLHGVGLKQVVLSCVGPATAC